MHPRIRDLALSVAVVVAAACASSGATRTSGSPDKLDRAQIESVASNSAYDVVSRLRPNWLRPAGMSVSGVQNGGAPTVLVYMDGHRMGGVDALRTITTTAVTSMEFLNPTRAATVLSDMSTGAIAAVIMINTK